MLLPRGQPFANPSLRVFKACSVESVIKFAGFTSDSTFSISKAISRHRVVVAASRRKYSSLNELKSW